MLTKGRSRRIRESGEKGLPKGGPFAFGGGFCDSSGLGAIIHTLDDLWKGSLTARDQEIMVGDDRL
jgi:hypothetical protein